MSRIGRLPIVIPAGVEVQITGDAVSVKGPRGTLSQVVHPSLLVQTHAGRITVERPSNTKFHKSLHGLTRTLIANMVKGVTEGFQKQLEVVGVGYRSTLQGRNLALTLGYSHPITFVPPPGIEFELDQRSTIIVKGADKYLVGQVAAQLRDLRKPEPYKGKGIRYVGERLRRKVGKKAG